MDVVFSVAPKRDPLVPATSQQRQRIGSDIEFYCAIIDGTPPAKIIWRKNGIDINVSQFASRVVISDSNRRLTIRDLVDGDSGVYQCHAVNNMGSDTITVKLKVFGEFRFALARLSKHCSDRFCSRTSRH